MLPNRIIHQLSYGCIALVTVYIALFALTLFFASTQNALSAEVRERESLVASLETEYYDALARLSAEEYVAAGFVSPVAVEYVSAGGDTAVTRADR